MINLRQAGPVNREDLKTLSVISGVQSVIPIPLYDTVAVANGNAATKIQFFSHTKGASGIAVTNLEQANILVSGKVEVVTTIRLLLQTPTGVQVAGTLADMEAFAHAVGAFTFKINNVEYAQGPISDLIGGKLYGFGTPAANVAYSASWNQHPEGFRMSPAVVIPTQVNFSMELEYAVAPNPAATLELVCELQGQQLRLASS
jgi:hypothetical protein